MPEPTWVRGANPPALTPAMKVAGQVWRRLKAKGSGFLWEPAATAPSGAAPSGAPSTPRGV